MHSRLKAAFDRFIDVQQHSDGDVVKLMREMGVDIALDLNGFTTGAQPGIFLGRCVRRRSRSTIWRIRGPLRDYIDYLIADETIVPRGEQASYAEKVVYLPDTYMVNDSERRIADRARRPGREVGLPDRGFVFCSFNNNYKITPECSTSGCAVAGSSRQRAVAAGRQWRRRRNLRREGGGPRVDADRLVFAPRIATLPKNTWRGIGWRICSSIPFPCNAHTTASDALWAGLPVLTCMGTTFAGRVAASLLQAIGPLELITHSLDEYESLALQLAKEPDALEDIRQELARNREVAPLFDTDRFPPGTSRRPTWRCGSATSDGEPPASFAVAPS